MATGQSESIQVERAGGGGLGNVSTNASCNHYSSWHQGGDNHLLLTDTAVVLLEFKVCGTSSVYTSFTLLHIF